MAARSWEAGDVVAGRYRLVARLGQGGMGAVWRAHDDTLACDVALKVLSAGLVDSEDGKKRFLLEARAAAKLRSPHVVHVMDHGVDDGSPFIVMELLEGESLAGRLARVGRLSLARTSRIVTQVARAITRAHAAGIVHRDLKPDNVFLVRNDDDEVAKVLDFGIAKGTEGVGVAPTVSTRSGALLGTPFYMSPEQVRGREVDGRTDVWALGVIAYECVVGRLPFESDTVGDLLLFICSEPLPVPSRVADVPAGFDEWFARAVCRDKEARFASARELATALARLAGRDGGSTSVAEGDDVSTSVEGGDVAGAGDALDAEGAADTATAPTMGSGDVAAAPASRDRSAAARSAPRALGRRPAAGAVTGGALTRSSVEHPPASRYRGIAIALVVGVLMVAAFLVQRGSSPRPAAEVAPAATDRSGASAAPNGGSPEASSAPAVVPSVEPPAATASPAVSVAAPPASAERSASPHTPKPAPAPSASPRPKPTSKDEVLAF